jgi:TatD DNase family protein
MFDTHCHLQADAFDADRPDVIQASREAGVSHFIVPATDLASFPGTLELAAADDRIYCALGIHPHSATEWTPDVRQCIAGITRSNSKVVAVGEIGLDYHYDFSPRDVQRRAFAEQIELAQELNRPIVIHTRESEKDVFAIVSEYYGNRPAESLSGQFHCFSEGVDRMQKAVSLGFFVSFTGNITFKNSTLADVVRETPLGSLLIETDSPYLAPHPFRGKRNSPVFLRLIAEKIAEIKGLDVSIIMKHTFENTLKLFKIPLTLAIFLILSVASVTAQVGQPPSGRQAPDSVLTGDRRKAEELRKKQEEELAKEAEQHRQDSIKEQAKELEEAKAQAREQVRQDSLKAAEKLADEEREREFMLTPQPWKAIGIGGNVGVGNMQMTLQKPDLTPTSVIEPGIQISTQLTRRLDFEISYSHMNVGDNFPQDSLYNYGTGTPPAPYYNPSRFNTKGETRLIQSENMGITALSFDFRYIITQPTALVKFYLGLGYTYLIMTNTQHYSLALDSIHSDNIDHINQVSFYRHALKVLFGMRHDFEAGSGFTIEPFAQIAMIAAFNGQNELPDFVFQPGNPIIATQASVGATLYFGWFGVPRQ